MIEACLLIVATLAFRCWPPIKQWLGRMPATHRAVLFLVLGGMVLGNFAPDSRTWFPFVKWDIFGYLREEDPITCREFWAVTSAGRGVRLLAEQLFPSIVQFDLPRRNDSAAMTDLVEALAREYNRRHANDPVRQVDLVEIAVKLHPARPGERPACEILRHYEISSVRSL